LAHKAGKSEVRKDTAAQPINVSEMDTETKSLFTGGAVAVVGVDAVGKENLKTKAVSSEKTDFVESGKNIFDFDAITRGVAVQLQEIAVVNESYWTSAFIPCKPGEVYSIKRSRYIAFYDNLKSGSAFVDSFINNSSFGAVTFTIPLNCYFFRFSDFHTIGIGATWVEKGSTLTNYEPFGYKFTKVAPLQVSQFSNEAFDYFENPDTNFSGKKICTYGDSITMPGAWQSYVLPAFKFGTHYNRGWSDSNVTMQNGLTLYINSDGTFNSHPASTPTQPAGTTEVNAAFCSDERIAYVPTDTDIVLVTGGTNDCLRNKPLGDFTTPYNELTFKGALASTVKKLQARLPNATIVLMTPIQRAKAKGTPEPFVSSVLNLTTKDYADAVKETANFIGCKVIDVYQDSGMNIFNTMLTSNDGIHPTAEGHKLIGKAVIGGLRTIVPVA